MAAEVPNQACRLVSSYWEKKNLAKWADEWWYDRSRIEAKAGQLATGFACLHYQNLLGSLAYVNTAT